MRERWNSLGRTSASTSVNMNGGDRSSFPPIFSPAFGHSYRADIPTSTIDLNEKPASLTFLPLTPKELRLQAGTADVRRRRLWILRNTQPASRTSAVPGS